MLKIRAILFTTLAIAQCALLATAQPKQGGAPTYPHLSTYYHNGDSIVRVNLALDELQVKSTQGSQLDVPSLAARGTVSPKSSTSARLRYPTPSTSLQSLNAEAKALRTPQQVPQAVVYPKGMRQRQENLGSVLTNQFLVKPNSGTTINDLARKYGFTDYTRLLKSDTIYVVDLTSDSLIAALEMANAIQESGDGEFAHPVFKKSIDLRRIPNDPNFDQQWHLLNTRTSSPFIAGNDLNVEGAWDTVTGAGVNILIVDTGVAVAHPDLSPNVRADLGYDFLDNDGDPTPFNSHGTSVAGLAAAKGDNFLGVAGSAFEASIVGVRLVDDTPTDTQILQALAYLVNTPFVASQAHVSNHSWGPSDSSPAVKQELTPAEESVMLNAVTAGRSGKGVIYVWAAGNGRGANQNISYDGYASSRYTIAVGASGGDGKFSTYSEPGASMLVTAPSSFSGGSITTTTGASTYTDGFGGTSASAPMVSGVVALLLEASPNLGWRDVQRILLTTATKIDLGNSGWTANGAGRLYNHNYGYGRVNATSAVSLASAWTILAPELPPLTALGLNLNIAIPDNNSTGISHGLFIESRQLFRVEHVEVTVNITHPSRGDLAISLTSPQGMRSVFTNVHTDGADDYNNWKFTSVAHWDENPHGIWTLKVNDGNGVDVGTLNSWSLRIYGNETPAVFVPTHTIPFFSEP